MSVLDDIDFTTSMSCNAHIGGKPTIELFEGDGAFAIRIMSKNRRTDATVFFWDVDKETVRRAVAAFASEMQREPIETREAAE
jgi:hypothetical protein